MTWLVAVLEIACRGFWQFLAVVVVLAVLVRAAETFWVRSMRSLCIALRGWPPPHLNADGNFKVLGGA